MPTRRFLTALLMAGAGLCTTAAPSLATDFKGATDSWGTLTATVSNGTLTAFKTRTGRLQTCSGKPDSGSSYDPQDLNYSGPAVAVVDGNFHLEGTTKDGWGDTFHWTADGSVSLDGRELTGTVTTSGDTVFEKGCTGTWAFDAIVAAHQSALPVRRTFMPASNNRSFNPSVTFTYRRGVITHLTANTQAECPDTSVLGAQLNTTAYDQDPVRVDKGGRFSITGAVLDGYGVVQHYVLRGRIKGHVASGTLSAFRYDSLRGQTIKCTQDTVWKSTTSQSTATRGPAAYFDVGAWRYGSPAAWSYYVRITLTGCAHANRARVAIAGGPSRTTSCHGRVKLGPLTPKRTYRVKVTALKTKRGRVIGHAPAVTVSVYLPGDDGNWIPEH